MKGTSATPRDRDYALFRGRLSNTALVRSAMSDSDLEAAQAALQAMEQLYRCCVFICVEPPSAPTVGQLQALQPFFPGQNFLAIRKGLVAGALRIGPVLPDAAPAFAQAALGGTGLAWHTEAPNESELLRAGVGAD